MKKIILAISMFPCLSYSLPMVVEDRTPEEIQLSSEYERNKEYYDNEENSKKDTIVKQLEELDSLEVSSSTQKLCLDKVSQIESDIKTLYKEKGYLTVLKNSKVVSVPSRNVKTPKPQLDKFVNDIASGVWGYNFGIVLRVSGYDLQSKALVYGAKLNCLNTGRMYSRL